MTSFFFGSIRARMRGRTNIYCDDGGALTSDDVTEHLLEDVEVAAVGLLQQLGHLAHRRLPQLRYRNIAAQSRTCKVTGWQMSMAKPMIKDKSGAVRMNCGVNCVSVENSNFTITSTLPGQGKDFV